MILSYVWDIETTGLNPAKDRILCAGCLSLEDGMDPIVYYGEDESEIIKFFFKTIEYSNQLIGFNSSSFDYPFLLTRAMLLDIPIPGLLHTIKYTDLRTMLNPSDNKAYGKLGEYGAALGFTISTENGVMMPIYYQQKQWDKIKAHLVEDLTITKNLYQRMKRIGVF